MYIYLCIVCTSTTLDATCNIFANLPPSSSSHPAVHSRRSHMRTDQSAHNFSACPMCLFHQNYVLSKSPTDACELLTSYTAYYGTGIGSAPCLRHQRAEQPSTRLHMRADSTACLPAPVTEHNPATMGPRKNNICERVMRKGLSWRKYGRLEWAELVRLINIT
jgi:hypothetical protein